MTTERQLPLGDDDQLGLTLRIRCEGLKQATTLDALGVDSPSESVADLLAAAAGPLRTLAPGERLIQEGEASTGVCLLTSGIVKAYRNLRDGGAQTLALYTAGEVVDSLAFVAGRATATIGAVTTSRVAEVPTVRLQALMDGNPAIIHALWRATAREAAILQEWVVGMGRRSAHSHVAHLICEIVLRLQLRPLSSRPHSFPLTQGELADIAGLSAVHVNRVVQSLRAEGLIELGRGWLRIYDWDRLVQVADFDPWYLRLEGPLGNEP